ncbi:hypothetical protein FOZ60_010162 [Perkinsus olseni]|uniref:Immunoglobulin super DCC subclass member n=1 Tax=Perkinsus olseni TaxID=32597 RepID=A0A7J6PC38_PEROL|nr:hypothetical protein FOZ60_010162 [Perkinsus olseni]
MSLLALSVAVSALQGTTYVMGSTTECDADCAATYPGSYCKFWKTPSTCFGSDAPCSCDSSATTEAPRNCDAGCASDTPGSYCKYWVKGRFPAQVRGGVGRVPVDQYLGHLLSYSIL